MGDDSGTRPRRFILQFRTVGEWGFAGRRRVCWGFLDADDLRVDESREAAVYASLEAAREHARSFEARHPGTHVRILEIRGDGSDVSAGSIGIQ